MICLRALVFFMPLLASGAAAEAPVHPEEFPEVAEALVADDQCAVDDVDCAVNALQRRGLVANISEFQLSSAHTSECKVGLGWDIEAKFTACSVWCPGICASLGAALKAYFTEGGMKAAKPIICHNKYYLSCALKHDPISKKACEPLFGNAAQFGLYFPTSPSGFETWCSDEEGRDK